MDLLKAQLARLQKQLSTLSASQKMLAATLVAIMVMTLFWWGHYAGTSEMEAVLNQDFAPDEITRVTTNIASRGIKYSVVGARVMVPSDRKYEVLAALSFDGLLPHDTQAGIEEMVKNMSSPFDPPAVQEDLRTKAKAMTLAQVLRNFPGVQNAVVVIDPSRVRGIGTDDVMPSASVSLEMRSGHPANRKLIDAAADLVSGAVANMPRGRVKVIADGATWPIRDAEEGGGEGDGGTWFNRRQEGERYFAQHILQQLSYIDGIFASVAVQPSSKSEKTKDITYDPDKIVTAEKSSTSDEEQTTNPVASGRAGESGVQPNVSMQVGNGAGGGEGASMQHHDQEKVEHDVFASSIERVSQTYDDLKVVGASVQIPRSYFVRILKQNHADKDPDDTAVDQLVSHELPKIRQAVVACLGLETADRVVVDTYVDVMPTLVAMSAPTESMVSSVGRHGREIALGALAVFSLFMVSMMVRKGAGTPATVIEAQETATVSSAARAAAKAAAMTPEELEEVGEAGAALDGVELDEESVRSKQVLDQVSSMVKENPDAAANLVRRWLNRP